MHLSSYGVAASPKSRTRRRATLGALALALVAAAPLRAQDASGGQLPRVVVLATGGTIASAYDSTTGALRAAISGEEIVNAVPGLKELARVSVEQIANVNSADITPSIWKMLARRANAVLAESDVAGVVVTHGTDTLEETAYFLDLTVTSDKPVILVGAQRAPTEFDSDGPRNMLNAVRVILSPESRGMGTMVVMNGQINAAREVTKTNTQAVETFQTLQFGLLGVADAETVRFYRRPTRRQTIALAEGEELPTVEIVPEYAGSGGRTIRALLEQGTMEGLVVAGVGLGHVSAGTLEAIREARSRGIPVVVSTRVLTGRIVPLYANNIDILETGAVEADNLSPQKARVLLMLAMTKTHDPVEIQAYFDR